MKHTSKTLEEFLNPEDFGQKPKRPKYEIYILIAIVLAILIGAINMIF